LSAFLIWSRRRQAHRGNAQAAGGLRCHRHVRRCRRNAVRSPGILTHDNPKFIEQLPDLTGMKSEVIIQKSHRNPFDHQLRSTGVKLVVVESRDDLKKAINPQTAMMHFTNFADNEGQIQVEEWVKLAHENQIPAFIDALPIRPPSHACGLRKHGLRPHRLQRWKSDARAAMRGSAHRQKGSSLVRPAQQQSHEDTLGRSQKVGKEEIVGMVKALESYLKEDHDALNKEWQRPWISFPAKLPKFPV